jgi:hypothetical protein
VIVPPPLVCDRCGGTLASEPLLMFRPNAELLCSSCTEGEGELSRADIAALTTFGAYWWGEIVPRAEELADHYLYRQPFYGRLYARFAEEFDRGKEDIALSARYIEVLLQDCGDPPARVAEILRGNFKVESVRVPLATCSVCGALASNLSWHAALRHGGTHLERAGSVEQSRHGVALLHREGWHGRSYHGEWASRAAGHFYATLVAAWSAACHLYGAGYDARTVARLEYVETLYPGFERQPIPPPVVEYPDYPHRLSGYKAEVRQRERYSYTLAAWEWADEDDENPRRDGDDDAGFAATDNVPLAPDHGFYTSAANWSDPADDVLSRAGVAGIWDQLNERERQLVVLASAGIKAPEIDTRLGRQPGWARQTRRRLSEKLARRQRESLQTAELIVDATARRWADADLRPEAAYVVEPGHGRAACGVTGPQLRLRQPKHEPPETPVIAGARCECGAEAETLAELDRHECPLPGWRQWSRAFRRHYPARSRPGQQRTVRRRELRALGFEPPSVSKLDRRDKPVVTFSPESVS